MINKVSLQNSEVYKKDYKSSPHNPQNNSQPSFKGPVELTTSVLQYCNTSPMAGVSLIDLVTAIGPRTIVDAKTNGFAAAETFRRESSGLIVNCLIPGFVVYGAAKGIEWLSKDNMLKGMSDNWANQDALETLRDHFKQSNGTSHDFVEKLLKDAEILKGKKWEKLKNLNLETELTEYANAITKKGLTKKEKTAAIENLYKKILNVAKGAEHIKINGEIYHDNFKTLLRDGIDVGKKFIVDFKGDHAQIDNFVKKATKFVNKKSLLGLAIVIPLAASMQTINRWITKKRSGKEGAPIYKDFVKENTKKEMSPTEKSKFWAKKIGAAALMTGVAYASLKDKSNLKNIFKGLQFTKNMPSMDQCRWIATSTFASRMLVSADQNELNEVTWRDIATFSSLYFLGDYVSKGVGSIIQHVTKGEVSLLNYMTETPKAAKNPLKKALNKASYWINDTKLKSFDEAAMVSKKAKGLRAMCEVSSLGFSMLLLGILVPWYVRKQTNNQVQKEMEKKYNSYHTWPSLNSTSNKKTFQAFGMMENKN